MAYDKTNRKLYIDKSSDKGGLALWQIADCLGYNKRDSRGNRNLGMIIKNAKITALARCKPFRDSATSYASAQAREAVRGKKASSLNDTSANNGFGPTPTINVENNDISHGVYEYRRPRGAEQNEPFRMSDFDGYWHFAPSPIQITWGELLLDGNSAVSILFHTGNGWNEAECLRVDELLDSYKVNEPFALLIVGGGETYLLPSTVTPADVAEGRINTVTIAYGADAAALQGNSSNAQGSYLLNLNPSYLGSEYAMAIVTSNTPAPDINPLNGLRDPLPANGDFGSLEFTQGSDRIYMPMSWLQSLKGLGFKWTENSWGYLYSRANPNSNAFRGAYELMGVDTLLTLYTPAAWHRTTVNVHVTIAMALAGVQVYNDSGTYVGDHVEYDATIDTSKISGGIRVPAPSETFQDNVLKESNIYKYRFCILKSETSKTAPIQVTIELQAKYGERVVDRIVVLQQKIFTLSIP